MSIPNSYSSGSIGGSNNAVGDMKFTYKGFEQTKTADNLVTRITYQGTKQRLEQERDSVNWKIGTRDLTYGLILSIDIRQDQGPWYNATVNYNKILDEGEDVPASALGPQHHDLDISMYSVPIEKHPNYDFRWNHYLFVTNATVTRAIEPGEPDPNPGGGTIDGKKIRTYNNWQRFLLYKIYGSLSASVAPFNSYGTYAALTAAQGDNWILQPFFKMDDWFASWITDEAGGGQFDPTLDILWAKDMNEKPRQPRSYFTYNMNTFAIEKLVLINYQAMINAWKPGVEFFDLPTYQITETGRYKDKTKCNWALKKGGLIAYPLMGDFGIQRYIHPDNLSCALSALKGYWLCEGGNIEFDGKYYNATCKYTWDILDEGWDQDIYLFYNSRKYYQDQSKLNPGSIMGNEILSTTVWDRNQWEQ